jgi:peptidoglycan/LPS O-acetylase OafA/YrhL
MDFGLLLTLVSLLASGIALLSREVKSCRRPQWLLQGGMLLALGALAGCGSGGAGSVVPPAPQNYTVTVTATSGSIQHSTTVKLTVGS